MKYTREEIIAALRKVREEGHPVIGTAAGIGLAAKCQDLGGADFIIADLAAKMRMSGFGSVPAMFAVKRAVSVQEELTGEILPMVSRAPVLAGINATEPFEDIDAYIDKMMEAGYSGIINSPSNGWNVGRNEKNLIKLGLGYDTETEMIGRAHRKDIFTAAMCYRENQARAMAEAGADVIIANLGLTAGGRTGAAAWLTEEEAAVCAEGIARAAKTVRTEVLVLFVGGVYTDAEKVKSLLRRVPELDGFAAGSAADRLPMEKAITSAQAAYKELRLCPGNTDR